MDPIYPPSPLTELTLPELRARRSMKWRTYPPDVLPLWVAEMDTPLAPPIREALSAAVAVGDTGYVHPGELAEAFAEFALARFAWVVDPKLCFLVPDVMQGVAAILERVTAPGDGVLINPPVYTPFYSVVKHTGRRVVECPLVPDATGRWTLDPDRLDHDLARTDVTGYLLCNPHNPTGTVFDHEELATVAELAERHGVRLIVDEIHGPLVHPGAVFTPFLAMAEEYAAAAGAVVLTSASKAWNLAGLKTAVLVLGPEAVGSVRVPPELPVRAALPGVLASEVAFRAGVPWLDALLAGLDANRLLLARALAEALPDVGYRPPEATYLAWLDCRSLPLGGADPAEVFLHRGRVALNPGPMFGTGGHGHVRLNFATSPEVLFAAVRAMARSVAE